MEQELQIYIDGKYYPKSQAKISVYDHGFLYGDGVFEGIRVYNGVVFKLKEHVQRLYDSAHAMMLKIPLTQEQMIQAVVETVRKNKLKDSYVRLIVTRGVGDLGLDPRKCCMATVIVIADHIKLHEGEAKIKGITTLVSWVRRDPVDGTSHEIKSLNYLNSVMAKLEANMSGADEAICLDKERMRSRRSRRKHLHRQKRQNLNSANIHRRIGRHNRQSSVRTCQETWLRSNRGKHNAVHAIQR